MPMGDVVLNAGERLALQCAVVKGGLPLSVSWFKDGQAILPSTSSSSSVRLINEFAVSLTVESLTGQHAGHYVYRAANQGGRGEASVHVVVQELNSDSSIVWWSISVSHLLSWACIYGGSVSLI